MIRALMSSLVFLFAVASLAAQEEPPASKTPPQEDRTPKHDEKAVELFKSMIGKVYKPMNSGLESCRFKFTVTQKVQDRVQQFGPYTVDWTPKKTVVTDAEGKTVPAPVERRATQAVVDFVGNDSFATFRDNHFELVDGRVKIVYPEWKTADPNAPEPVSYISCIPDDRGLLATQQVVARTGKVLLERSFEYEPHGQLFKVVAARSVTPDARIVNNYERSEVGGFLIPTKITTLTTVAEETVTYTDFVPNPPATPTDH